MDYTKGMIDGGTTKRYDKELVACLHIVCFHACLHLDIKVEVLSKYLNSLMEQLTNYVIRKPNTSKDSSLSKLK